MCLSPYPVPHELYAYESWRILPKAKANFKHIYYIEFLYRTKFVNKSKIILFRIIMNNEKKLQYYENIVSNIILNNYRNESIL